MVSGIASDIGFGVGRILKHHKMCDELFGIDIKEDHPGMIVFDRTAVAPLASDANYLQWLIDYIDENKIDLFIPTTEAEICRLVESGSHNIGGTKVLLNHPFTISKSLDKFECLNHLEACGIPVPIHGLVGNKKPLQYPVIVKPRFGQGSKGIVLVSDEDKFNHQKTGQVWQEYLSPDDEEYTCAAYATPSTEARILIMKRKLVGGLTGSGIISDNIEIRNYVSEIIKNMMLNGSINIQLRLTNSGPLLFEINPRLSSTVVFRDKLGFADLRWWVATEMGLPVDPYNPPKVGARFYRGSYEYIL